MAILLNTPIQSEVIIRRLEADTKGFFKPILNSWYSEHQRCFLAFHPFLKVLPQHEAFVHFGIRKGGWGWPTKTETVTHCKSISWTEFLKNTGLPGYKELDQCLSFLHHADDYVKRDIYMEFKRVLYGTDGSLNYIPPQIWGLPEIWENKLFEYLGKLGYLDIILSYIYSPPAGISKVISINNILRSEKGLLSHPRIETIDKKLVIIQDIDLRFTFFFGKSYLLDNLVRALDLEGFYCDNLTTSIWSYEEIPENEKMSWEENCF